MSVSTVDKKLKRSSRNPRRGAEGNHGPVAEDPHQAAQKLEKDKNKGRKGTIWTKERILDKLRNEQTLSSIVNSPEMQSDLMAVLRSLLPSDASESSSWFRTQREKAYRTQEGIHALQNIVHTFQAQQTWESYKEHAPSSVDNDKEREGRKGMGFEDIYEVSIPLPLAEELARLFEAEHYRNPGRRDKKTSSDAKFPYKSSSFISGKGTTCENVMLKVHPFFKSENPRRWISEECIGSILAEGLLPEDGTATSSSTKWVERGPRRVPLVEAVERVVADFSLMVDQIEEEFIKRLNKSGAKKQGEILDKLIEVGELGEEVKNGRDQVENLKKRLQGIRQREYRKKLRKINLMRKKLNQEEILKSLEKIRNLISASNLIKKLCEKVSLESLPSLLQLLSLSKSELEDHNSSFNTMQALAGLRATVAEARTKIDGFLKEELVLLLEDWVCRDRRNEEKLQLLIYYFFEVDFEGGVGRALLGEQKEWIVGLFRAQVEEENVENFLKTKGISDVKQENLGELERRDLLEEFWGSILKRVVELAENLSQFLEDMALITLRTFKAGCRTQAESRVIGEEHHGSSVEIEASNASDSAPSFTPLARLFDSSLEMVLEDATFLLKSGISFFCESTKLEVDAASKLVYLGEEAAEVLQFFQERTHQAVGVFPRKDSTCLSISGKYSSIGADFSSSLEGELRFVAKQSLEHFHSEKMNSLELVLDGELWERTKLQEAFVEKMESGTGFFLRVERSEDFRRLRVLKKEGLGNRETNVEESGLEEFWVIPSTIIFLSSLNEYISLYREKLPSLTRDILVRITVFSRIFMTKTRSLVLEGEAIQKGAKKKITASNLAAASQQTYMIAEVLLRSVVEPILGTNEGGGQRMGDGELAEETADPRQCPPRHPYQGGQDSESTNSICQTPTKGEIGIRKVGCRLGNMFSEHLKSKDVKFHEILSCRRPVMKSKSVSVAAEELKTLCDLLVRFTSQLHQKLSDILIDRFRDVHCQEWGTEDEGRKDVFQIVTEFLLEKKKMEEAEEKAHPQKLQMDFSELAHPCLPLLVKDMSSMLGVLRKVLPGQHVRRVFSSAFSGIAEAFVEFFSKYFQEKLEIEKLGRMYFDLLFLNQELKKLDLHEVGGGGTKGKRDLHSRLILEVKKFLDEEISIVHKSGNTDFVREIEEVMFLPIFLCALSVHASERVTSDTPPYDELGFGRRRLGLTSFLSQPPSLEASQYPALGSHTPSSVVRGSQEEPAKPRAEPALKKPVLCDAFTVFSGTIMKKLENLAGNCFDGLSGLLQLEDSNDDIIDEPAKQEDIYRVFSEMAVQYAAFFGPLDVEGVDPGLSDYFDYKVEPSIRQLASLLPSSSPPVFNSQNLQSNNSHNKARFAWWSARKAAMRAYYEKLYGEPERKREDRRLSAEKRQVEIVGGPDRKWSCGVFGSGGLCMSSGSPFIPVITPRESELISDRKKRSYLLLTIFGKRDIESSGKQLKNSDKNFLDLWKEVDYLRASVSPGFMEISTRTSVGKRRLGHDAGMTAPEGEVESSFLFSAELNKKLLRVNRRRELKPPFRFFRNRGKEQERVTDESRNRKKMTLKESTNEEEVQHLLVEEFKKSLLTRLELLRQLKGVLEAADGIGQRETRKSRDDPPYEYFSEGDLEQLSQDSLYRFIETRWSILRNSDLDSSKRLFLQSCYSILVTAYCFLKVTDLVSSSLELPFYLPYFSREVRVALQVLGNRSFQEDKKVQFLLLEGERLLQELYISQTFSTR